MTNLDLLLGLFPEHIAIQQAAYERHRQVLRAFQRGASMQEIAFKLGVSRSRAYQMRNMALEKRLAPARAYFRQTWGDYERLTKRRTRYLPALVERHKRLWAEHTAQ